MLKYTISYRYLDNETKWFIYKEISGNDLNELWKEYLRIGENHDLAKFGPRSITNIKSEIVE